MVLAEVVTYIASKGLGTAAVDLFYGYLPPDPDVVTVLFEYGGMGTEHNMGTPNIRLEFPRIQVVTRGVKDDYDGPRLQAQKVLAALNSIANVTLSGIQYGAATPLQSPFFLRRDDNYRILFACNYQIQKGYSAT